MGKYFGTDGIRGVVNDTLDATLAYKTGCAAATVLLETTPEKPLILIGKDTRVSSDMLEAALIAGICSGGADVIPLGVLPTPAVAFLTINMNAGMGIVISASHNPFEHNGIKIFDANGFKLSDVLEERIEQIIDGDFECAKKTHGDIGRVLSDDGRGAETYIEHIAGAVKGDLSELRVAVDCANGAASETAARLFLKLGIDFDLINEYPNGTNINENCGSTHIETLCSIVQAGGFDVGFAFDGDADRCLVVDETGAVIDGDKMMAAIGRGMLREGTLKNAAVVATVMSNLGFHEFADNTGFKLLCAAVGDRNVLEMMRREGCNLGGEQSGHIIFLDEATTGDGQLAAIKFLNVLAASGGSVSELVADVPQYPQVLLNMPVTGGNDAKQAIMASASLRQLIEAEEARLSGTGRVLVRASGTEALIRVMVEAKTEQAAYQTAENLLNMIKSL